MKSKATGCGSILAVFSTIVLLCVSSIIIIIIIIMILMIIVIIIIIIIIIILNPGKIIRTKEIQFNWTKLENFKSFFAYFLTTNAKS